MLKDMKKGLFYSTKRVEQSIHRFFQNFFETKGPRNYERQFYLGKTLHSVEKTSLRLFIVFVKVYRIVTLEQIPYTLRDEKYRREN